MKKLAFLGLSGSLIMPFSSTVYARKHDVKVNVYDPCGAIQPVKTISLAPRLSSLRGKVIGLVSNSKPGASLLFPHVKELVERNFGSKALDWLIPMGSLPDKPEILKQILNKCDAVITGVGD